MTRRRVSSLEVAEAAGVSRTTVSFVLNNAPGKLISEETRARVLDAARRLGYVPDAGAQRVARSTRSTVGLFVSHSGSIYSDAYILRLLEGMGPVLNRNRTRLVLLPVREPCDFVALAAERGLDGVVITNLRRGEMDLGPLAGSGVPTVLVGASSEPGICQIDIDNRGAAATAVRHLLELGHREIGMIVHCPLSYVAATDRLQGYRDAIEGAGLRYDERLVRVADFSEESGRAAMLELLAAPRRPTAVFAGNDEIAYGALAAAEEAGARVPEDLSLVGFDDDYPSRFIDPPLTTVALPALALGERSARLVLDLMEGAEATGEPIRLPTALAVRESSAPPRAAAPLLETRAEAAHRRDAAAMALGPQAVPNAR